MCACMHEDMHTCITHNISVIHYLVCQEIQDYICKDPFCTSFPRTVKVPWFLKNCVQACPRIQ